MSRFGLEFQVRVMEMMEQAQRALGAGAVAAAIVGYRDACVLVRDAVEAEPETVANAQQLASMLYTLGEWELNAGEYPAAVETLTEAESLYLDVGESGGPLAGVDSDQMVADVVIRRARAHAAAREPLSAMTDAQHAVTVCLNRLDAAADDQRRVEAARVVAHAAQVQLTVGGDPDLAVGAADWALREFVAAFRTSNEIVVPAVHAPALQLAGRVAYVVHTAAGRAELARAARVFGGDVSPSLDQFVDAVRTEQPTLAGVLEELKRPDLVRGLTAETPLLVPATRCDPQLAPGYAEALTGLQTQVGVDRFEVLLGLEAHALFAAASRRQVDGMRYQFGHFGQLWATAVMNFGQRTAEQQEWAAAIDAANWLTAIMRELFPHAMVDAQARKIAMAATQWQHNIYTVVGDSLAADDAAQAITVLAGLDKS